MGRISVKIIADLDDVIVYEQDEFKRYLIYFKNKKLGFVTNRSFGVSIQYKVKQSWETKHASTIDDFYKISRKITEGKQTGKSITHRKLLKRKITDEKKEQITKKILGWLDKNDRYGTEVSTSELVVAIGEIADDIINSISTLFKTHNVLQMHSSRFIIHTNDVSALPLINTRTGYIGKTTIIGSENKKALFDNVKKFSQKKKKCNDCEKFVPKHEIYKGLCNKCRKG